MAEVEPCCDAGKCCVAKCFQGEQISNTILEHLHTVFKRKTSLEYVDFVKRECTDIDSLFMHPENVAQSTRSSCVIAECPILFGRGAFNWLTYKKHWLYICDIVTFSKVEKFLEFLNIKQKGIASPYLYFWESHYKLAWEIEDYNVSSMNDLPTSSCRVWFILPWEHTVVFELLLSHLLNLNSKQWISLNLLGNSSVHAVMPRDEFKVLSCSMIYHNAIDCSGLCPSSGVNFPAFLKEVPCAVREVRILTEPYHSVCPCIVGYKNDDNIYNVINTSRSCQVNIVPSNDDQCFSEIDVEENHLKYEACNETQDAESSGKVNADSALSITVQKGKRKYQRSLFSHHSSKSSEQFVKCACVGHQLLQCPACAEAVKGGEDRVERLLEHVRTRHSKQVTALTRYIRKLYPMKACPSNLFNTAESDQVKLASCCSLMS